MFVAEAGPGHAELFFDARVVAVGDGDTIEVVRELAGGRKERVTIRLSGVDAPEKGQAWGRRAREALSKRVVGKEVRINAVTTDRYGRTVGEVYADDVCVACELCGKGTSGCSAATRTTACCSSSWPKREQRAEVSGRCPSRSASRPGIGAMRARHEAIPAGPAPEGDAGFRCEGKRYCREMRSCAEAHFHLERCGLTRLDGDGDGTPCEVLCGGGS